MLIDSNIIIYITNGIDLDKFLHDKVLYASIISKIEVLGFNKISEKNQLELISFFNAINILELSNPIVDTAIHLRQRKKISLGDSIIAATAIEYNLPLITANIVDFKWIKELEVINPIKN